MRHSLLTMLVVLLFAPLSANSSPLTPSFSTREGARERLHNSYVWNRERMLLHRDHPSDTVTAAVAAIVRDADKRLGSPAPSVVNKRTLPPSGDKHDYYSMARYWWPNPDTPDHLPYVRRDGQVNPEIEGLDRPNLDAFEKALRTFTLAYFYTEDDKYAAAAWDVLRTWFINKKTRMNPNMAYSQVRLGHDNNQGSNSGLLDGYSFLIVPDAVDILSASRYAKAKDIHAIRQWFTQYLQWMLTSPQGIKEDAAENNHGTAYHIQVAVYARFTGNDSVWNTYSNSFCTQRLEKQVLPDGRQPHELTRTRAFGYSCYNIKHFLDMEDILRNAHSSSMVIRTPSLRTSIDFLKPYLGKPVTAWPYEQISDWSKEQQNFCWILYRAADIYPESDYKKLFRLYNKAKQSHYYYLIY